MKPGLRTGHQAQVTLTVSVADTIALGLQAGGGDVVVFSTPAMINLMEHSARAVLGPFLEPGEESVGADVQVEHVAPTPMGATVTAKAIVTEIEGRRISFRIEASDGRGEIGRGTHRRAVVALETLRKRVESTTGVARGAEGPTWAGRPTVNLFDQGRICRLELNRPARLNAVDTHLTEDLEGALDWIEAGVERWSVLVVAGVGGAFCAGEDVVEAAGLDGAAHAALAGRRARVMARIRELPLVTIASVKGPALGAGFVLAASCDLRVASTCATFGLPEIRLGWPPAYGWRAAIDLLGSTRALEGALLGDSVKASEAERRGWVRSTVPTNRLEAEVEALAQRLVALPAAALRATKQGMRRAVHQSADWADLAALDAFSRCRESADAHEGLAAFVAKRKPRFGADH